MAGRDERDADDDEHSPDDGRPEGLHELERPTAHEQVGPDRDRQQQGAEAG